MSVIIHDISACPESSAQINDKLSGDRYKVQPAALGLYAASGVSKGRTRRVDVQTDLGGVVLFAYLRIAGGWGRGGGSCLFTRPHGPSPLHCYYPRGAAAAACLYYIDASMFLWHLIDKIKYKPFLVLHAQTEHVVMRSDPSRPASLCLCPSMTQSQRVMMFI